MNAEKQETNFYDKSYYGKPTSESINTIHPAKARETEFFKKLVYPKQGDKVLDVGCGTGLFLASLEESEADLWGVDISKNATDMAKKKVKKPQQIICKEIDTLPFSEDEFDLITAWGVIEHFSSISLILGEIRRVAKIGKKIAIMVPNTYYYKFIWDTLRKGTGPVKHQETEFLYSFKEWKNLIELAGLGVEKVFRHNKFNKSSLSIWLRKAFIPFYFSNHFIFICTK
ncbi:MAG: class I SAM-dependent methyltransferase [Omnitrophica bacterium]|nr:class I SAM-dependent methyltransferase [Candidatus Omnitrophota bacterium]